MYGGEGEIQRVLRKCLKSLHRKGRFCAVFALDAHLMRTLFACLLTGN